MKFLTACVAVALVVTGCTRPAPQSDDYFETITPQSDALRNSEERLRAAEDRARTAAQASAQTPSATPSTVDLIEQAENELDAAEAPAPVTPRAPRDTSAVSNADDFEAIQEVETVQSELERVEELGKTYKTFDPKALPTRRGGVDLDAYAAKFSNRKVGRKRFRRDRDAYTENFCVDYVDQELAQVRFLSQDGPKKDPLLLDPDGDGFACSWTPATHNLAKARRASTSTAFQ